jgi:hypothetical protein
MVCCRSMSVLYITITRTSCQCPSTLWKQIAVPTVAAKGPRSMRPGPSRWRWSSSNSRTSSTPTSRPGGTTVNTSYIMDAMGRYCKIVKHKKLAIITGECCFHLDNAPVHTTAAVTGWMLAGQTQVIQFPSYSPLDLAPTINFLLPRIRRELAGQKTF